MPEKAIYKVQLYKYQRVRGYTEELVIVGFQPAKVDGFGVLKGRVNKQYTEKYEGGSNG